MSSRADGGFSQRVWDEIDRTVASVKAANCTARRFLEVDGPYGMGLTSVAGAEVRLQTAAPAGASAAQWNVPPTAGSADPRRSAVQRRSALPGDGHLPGGWGRAPGARDR